MRSPSDSDAERELSSWPRVGRRPLLKALGGGAAVSLASGIATAGHDDPHPPHIDSHYGYATPDADDIPERLDPDHEVGLHVAPPIGEEQPELFYFDPAGLAVESGDIVQFTFNTPDHTVTPYHPAHGFQRRVPEDTPPFSSPIVNVDGAWLYRFDDDGVYDLYCGPHHILGMVMRVVVGDLDSDEIPEYEDTFEGTEGGEDQPPLLPPFSQEMLEAQLNQFSDQNDGTEWVWLTPQEVLDASALDPDNIQNEGAVGFEDVIEEIDRFSEVPAHN